MRTDDGRRAGGDSERDGPDAERSPSEAATTVVVSYPADLSSWGRGIVEGSPFRAYLRKTLETLEPGHTVEEFVGVGCCGSTLDVPLRIESVDGGDRMAPDTEIEFTVREACGIEGGWRVQSAGGPTR